MPTRRQVLQTAALSAIAAPNILRAQNSKQKIRVACVGIGQMGNGAVQGALEEELVAFCDVDWRELGPRSAGTLAKTHPDVPKFTDFREMLDKKGSKIDAVLISTPDHTHFAARGTLPPVQIHWYEGGLRPEALPGMEKGLPDDGMIMKGSKETLFSNGMRVQSPRLWPCFHARYPQMNGRDS